MDGMMRPLEEMIGPTRGRINAWQHVERTKFALTQIPEEMWPTVGHLNGRFEGFRGVIVGGGPSLDWDLIRKEAEARDNGEKVRIFAPNRSYDACLAQGITPDYGVLMDPAEHVANYIAEPQKDSVFLIGTGVHWKVLKQMVEAEAKCMLWTPLYDVDGADALAIHKAFPKRPITFISGGSTVGMRLTNILIGWGMEPHLHGFDSAYLPGTDQLYAYDKPETVNITCEATIESKKTGRQLRFVGNEHMVRQAMAFEGLMNRLPDSTVDGKPAPTAITVYGDGAIPWMAWLDGGDLMKHANLEAMQAKYGDHEAWDYQKNEPCKKLAPKTYTAPIINNFTVTCQTIENAIGPANVVTI